MTQIGVCMRAGIKDLVRVRLGGFLQVGCIRFQLWGSRLIREFQTLTVPDIEMQKAPPLSQTDRGNTRSISRNLQ